MQQIDDKKIPDDEKDKPVELGRELKGVNLRSATWEKVEADQTHVVFSRKLPKYDLEIFKTYSLVKVPADSMSDRDYKAYNLEFSVKSSTSAKLSEKWPIAWTAPMVCPPKAGGMPTKSAAIGAGRACATWWFRSIKRCRQWSAVRRSPATSWIRPGKTCRSPLSASTPSIFPL